MKTLLYLIFLFSLTACSSKPEEKVSENPQSDSIKTITKSLDDSIVIKVDTLSINNQKFIQTRKDERFYCLVSITGDTIVKSEDYYFKAEFIDINEDGYKDIRVFIMSNTGNQCDNYFFDSKEKIFRRIGNCDLDIERIKGTDFYYSYNAAGCADLNWESYLSKIENYQLLVYGYIDGRGCEFDIENNPQIIKIYKVAGSDTEVKVLFKELPYLKFISDHGSKSDFIKKYWSQNCQVFDR